MKKCRKCEADIPASIVIDGKRRNLGNRKFCLDCSPFGNHNTKPDDPARKPVYGQENYKKKSYSVWDEYAKDIHRARIWKRGMDRKEKLIAQKGGKCQNCGYDKCLRALSFHHRNPEEKLFTMDTRMIRGRKWETVLAEAEKCDLLCANCHMEIHAEESNIYLDILEQRKEK